MLTGTPVVQRLTRLLSSAPEGKATAAGTQTVDQEVQPAEPQRTPSAQQETQTAEPEADASCEAALRAENEQLLSLARKQDAMLAGLQADLEVRVDLSVLAND